jgi:hypothetical protein
VQEAGLDGVRNEFLISSEIGSTSKQLVNGFEQNGLSSYSGTAQGKCQDTGIFSTLIFVHTSRKCAVTS